ncbi:cytochrome P450 [Rhodococcus sp. NCIMB 12038]|uniref:cytochrome P450/oxidoreductase n=1 Tax=Rhodococcus sp. NCIMB 12038 TaxID=933800 RepID=UPI0015C5F862|nr:cytochrome P450 [Rhodococcus sp. NCIMB 12038]
MMTAIIPIELPILDWASPDQLEADPFPLYQRLRAEAPVAFVPATAHAVVSRYDDCRAVEADQETFTAVKKVAVLDRAVGSCLMTKDDPAHAPERQTINTTLRTKQVQNQWRPVFQSNAELSLRILCDAGQGADLNEHFAAPFAAMNLRSLVGLPNVAWQDIVRWSRSFVAASANHLEDPQIWESNAVVHAEVDEAIAEMIPRLRENPDSSILSAFLTAGHSEEIARGNVKLAIGGGFNEPQHALTSAVWALTNHPDQLSAALADPGLFPAVFAETMRWQSPIGMVSREATVDTEIAGVPIPAGMLVGVSVHSANRDNSRFPNGDRFDISRDTTGHYGFGSGTHMCAGRWVAECAVGQVALPMLYSALPGLTVPDADALSPTGWIFRGLKKLPVEWDVRSTSRVTTVTAAGGAGHQMTVLDRRQTASDVVELVLASVDNHRLPPTTAGTHATLQLPTGIDRHYSLIETGRDLHSWRIAVRRARDGRGGSAYLHDHLSVGDTLTVSGIRNNFVLSPASTYCFVAGGIGITPIMPMIREAEERNTPWSLLYLGTSRDRMAYLDTLTEFGDKVTVWSGDERGTAPLDQLLSAHWGTADVYACGPASMLDHLEAMAAHSGCLSRLHVERFNAIARGAETDLRPFRVRLARSGKEYEVGANQTIVEALDEAGVATATSCLEGTCGTCETRVLEGCPSHRDAVLSAIERQDTIDRMMICVSRAATDQLTLDL